MASPSNNSNGTAASGKFESSVQTRERNGTLRYSVGSLFQIIHEQDHEKGDVLAANQKANYDLKRDISIGSKKNFNLERDIFNLDKKIALLIRNRITLEEVIASSGDINSMLLQRTTTLKDKREREHYGQLFHLLQRQTSYTASLARLVKLGEIDNLLQTVMFTLYGNQYDDEEEHLLLSMFQKVILAEFNESLGIGNLLRANTALTRMMTTYTRRGPGQTYLKATLTGVLMGVVQDKDTCLEINPLKVYESYIIDYETKNGKVCPLPRKVTAEEAAVNPEIQAIIRPRIQKLDELATRFIDAIIASLDSVPYGIRWICKQIREFAKDKYPKATREQVCSLIGGFFLLRFVNPAVVTPQAFMLVDAKLSANTRRNLTLLAKILQNLANNAQFGGLKEFFMSPLNEFLGNVRSRFNTFLEDLTRVQDLDEHLQLDRYLRLGKTSEATIHITLNEMYFIHALLVEHMDVLCKEANDNSLKEILSELGPAPPQLPRKDNANVDLALLNRYQSAAGPTGDGQESKPEQLYTETKYLLFTVIKSLPRMPPNTADDINALLDEAQKYAMEKKDKDFKLADKIKKIHANLKKLEAEGVITQEDNFAKLRRDTVQELVNYEFQIQKTSTDVDRLKNVLKNIHEHNEFLKQQYDAYKEYLNNVRQNCSSTPNKPSKAAKKGPFKFNHVKLQQDGVIIESEVPEERRSNIFFSFSSSVPGTFDVNVMYKNRNISEMKLQLDDLLERQHNNNLELETDFLKLNVNLLIFLLNKTFMS
eukprot:TRINITY_DN1777_c0_g3_i1.p1 TRINITY_DN1777_c0_g3~~TRINITY_DN1777_c0_g3_i1.p1  ORF type:complete len:766 (+),score=273.66 TRINITY_DN1777_c0_g3_i1:272-2569(+)